MWGYGYMAKNDNDGQGTGSRDQRSLWRNAAPKFKVKCNLYFRQISIATCTPKNAIQKLSTTFLSLFLISRGRRFQMGIRDKWGSDSTKGQEEEIGWCFWQIGWKWRRVSYFKWMELESYDPKNWIISPKTFPALYFSIFFTIKQWFSQKLAANFIDHFILNPKNEPF